jgi:hypothetical protein
MNVLGRCLKVALITGVGLVTAAGYAHAQCVTVTNPPSRFAITIDGKFTAAQEWSDITPTAFKLDANGNLFRTCPGDATATSLVYTSLDPGVDSLYLLYDFLQLSRAQVAAFSPGQTVAVVSFPIQVNQAGGTVRTVNTDVLFKVGQCNSEVGCGPGGGDGGPTATVIGGGSGAINIFVRGDFFTAGTIVTVLASQLATQSGQPVLNGALSFGTSPNSATEHAIAELEVPLRIPAGFGVAFPGSGVDPFTGLYDPSPKFWSSGFKTNPNDPDPPSSGLITTIRGNGSTTVVATIVPTAAFALKQMAIDALKGVTLTNAHDAAELAEAIAGLVKSVNTTLFATRPERVFDLDADAAHELAELARNTRLTATQKAVVTGAITKLLTADRQIATAAIADGRARHVSAVRITRATALVAEGDGDVAKGHLEAIDDYAGAFFVATSQGGDDR